MIMVFGWMKSFGRTTMNNNEIVKTLTLMCDKNDPQDKKLLLLAELVETRCASLAEHQGELQKSLKDTNDKLDRMTKLLEQQQQDGKDCPVYRNKENFEKISFLMRYPRFSLLMLLGVIALLAGFFGASVLPYLKVIFGV